MTGKPAERYARGYGSLALTGSPASRLQDDTARMLASGSVPRCPHPERPAFWYLPAGTLTCAECAGDLALPQNDRCHWCGGPAAAVAAWVSGDVPCLASLCEPCSSAGLVPVMPN